MSRKIKLATKMYVGFASMVVIAGVLGSTGWYSLRATGRRVENADDGDRLIQYAHQCRQQEKDFMLRRDKKDQEENNATMQAIYNQLGAARTRLEDSASRNLLGQIEMAGKEYKTNFDGWVTLSDRQAAQDNAMVESARTFGAQCQSLGHVQKEQAEKALQLMKNISKFSRAHLNWAAGVRQFLLDQSQAALPVEKDGTKCGLGQWLAGPEFKQQAEIAGAGFQATIERMRADHLALHASALEVEKARQAGTNLELETFNEKTAPVLKRILGNFEELEESVAAVYDSRLANVEAAGRLMTAALECRRQEKNFQLRGDAKVAKDEKSSAEKLHDQAKGILDECDKLTAALEAQADKDTVARAKQAAEAYIQAFDGWVALWRQQQVNAQSMAARADEFVKVCGDFRADQQAKMQAVAAECNLVMISGICAAILLGSVLAVMSTRNITKPINRIVAGLTDGAGQVNAAAAQVSSAAQQLAEGASEQASSLEETSSALEQMAAMTRTNAENARQAEALAIETRVAAEGGDKSMVQLNQAMTGISESSGQISKIIKVIEEIAFQTNLLALNAAVEAARAGEHGKGFAVVAEEVRNLAQRCAGAAKDTTGLIEDAVHKARQGTHVSGEVGKSLAAIVGQATKVSDLIKGIARASQEQAQGVEQVNIAVSQMDRVTQQNAAGAEESASAAEQLSAQAQTVKGMLNELIVLVHGGRGDDDLNAREVVATASATAYTPPAPSVHIKKAPLRTTGAGAGKPGAAANGAAEPQPTAAQSGRELSEF